MRFDKEIQRLEKASKTSLKLILDNETRWSSVFRMLDRFLTLAPVVKNYPNLSFDEADFADISGICDIMEVISMVTTTMQSQSLPTLMLYSYMVQKLQVCLQALKPKLPPHTRVTDFFNAVCSSVDSRVSEEVSEPLVTRVGYLNPMLDKSGMTDISKDVMRTWILKQMVEVQAQDKKAANVETSPDPESSLFDQFFPKVNHPAGGVNLEKEIELFIQEPPGGPPSRCLDFWTSSDSKQKYPCLSMVAARYLPMLASSAPSERVFSAMNLIVTKERNRLTPERMEQLVILVANYHIYDTDGFPLATLDKLVGRQDEESDDSETE